VGGGSVSARVLGVRTQDERRERGRHKKGGLNDNNLTRHSQENQQNKDTDADSNDGRHFSSHVVNPDPTRSVDRLVQ
jgi:hypothetical protein